MALGSLLLGASRLLTASERGAALLLFAFDLSGGGLRDSFSAGTETESEVRGGFGSEGGGVSRGHLEYIFDVF